MSVLTDDVTLLVPYLAKKLADPAFQYPKITVKDVFSYHPVTLVGKLSIQCFTLFKMLFLCIANDLTFVGYGSRHFFANRKRNKFGMSKPRRTSTNVTWGAIGKETSLAFTGGASVVKLELRYKLTARDSDHRPGNWCMDELFFKEK